MGPFQNGELCVKGPLLMKGYCDNGSNGISSFDADGWVHSGDIAYYDNEYDFYVIDRLKELIKYKGFQVIHNFSPPITEIKCTIMRRQVLGSR